MSHDLTKRAVLVTFLLLGSGAPLWANIPSLSPKTTPEQKEPVQQSCSQLYKDQGYCQESRCFMGCPGGIMYPGCEIDCRPKPCLQIPAEKCPLDRCQVIDACQLGGEADQEKKICYDRPVDEPEDCGGLAYVGALECCPGLEKRCGIEFFDGSCDMEGRGTAYAAPLCLPCGNGTCNQFENRCNCPQDCAVTSHGSDGDTESSPGVDGLKP